MKRFITERLTTEFQNQESFTREELFEFYLQFEPDLKEGTFGWRIYDLKQKETIKQIKTGVYTISYKPKYKPNISESIYKIAKLILKSFDDVKFCVWNINWLNEFSRHQFSSNVNMVEAEKDMLESFFYHIKDNNYKNTYLKPDNSIIELYISEHSQSVIVNQLVSRAPLQKLTVKKVKVPVPTLEKILVDLFSEESAFYFLKGAEMEYIFENAISRYTINFSKLFSYARRRGKEGDLKLFLSQNLNHLIRDIIE